MKFNRGDIISYLLLLGLCISVFSLNPIHLDTTKRQTILDNLSQLKQLTANIDRDALRVGYSMLQHYDSIATSIRDIRILKSSLMQHDMDRINGMSKLLEELDTKIEKKIKASEKVVSHFALLNNSLLYFPTLIEEFSTRNNNDLNTTEKKLVIDILSFNKNPGNNNKESVYSTLTELKKLASADAEHEIIKAIDTHAKIIIAARGAVSNHINILFDIPVREALDKISAHYEIFHSANMHSAEQQRYLINLLVLVLIVGIAYSINRIRASKLALGIKEERLKHALEGANNGLWDWNIQDNELYLSPHFKSMLELAPDNTHTQINGIKELLHPDDLDQVRQRLKRHLQGESEIFESEHRFRKNDGSWIWTLCCGRVVARDKKHRPTRMVGIQTDISQRKQIEEELRRDSKVFETVSEAVMISDKDNLIIAVNEAFTKITGYSKDDVIGKNPKILSSGKHGADFYRDMWDTIIQKGVWQGEIMNRKKNGEIFTEWLSIATINDSDQKIDQYISVFSDISKRKEDEELIRFQANYDALTELPNRHLLMERLGFELQRAKREQTLVALMFIDLDRFKPINDTYGHMVGDQLLWEVSKRLSSHVRETDMVARLGGDEFTIILPNIENTDEVEHMAGRILNEISRPFYLNGCELFISVSIGITIYPNDASDFPTLLTNADNAMYRAKDEGRNTFCFFTHEMNQHAKEKLHLESDLHRAQQKGELVPYFQPIIDINSGELIGAETLLRWKHPEHGLMRPKSFIPISDASGLIVPIGRWLLETVCCQVMRWRRNGLMLQRICVNISARQFHDDLIGIIKNALETSGLEAQCLELEVVETVLLEDNKVNSKILKEISEMGVRLSIDDFGTGYSSLGYLKRFPFDVLKINRSFIKELPTSKEDATLVNTIISMGHGLDLEIVAEGVETEEQLEYLRLKGCDSAQGFYFNKPMPAHLFEKSLQKSSVNVSAGV